MVSVELAMPTLRRESYNQDQNHVRLACNLDLLEEVCNDSRLLVVLYQQRVTRYYNSRVCQKLSTAMTLYQGKLWQALMSSELD